MRTIDRGFVRTKGGEIHLRQVAGEGTPLLLVHASPGSSRALVPLLSALAGSDLPLIAPDTPGNGDSDDLAPADPDMDWYADALAALLDRLGLDQVDLYGTHTGARIAVETAARHPARVGRLILDGLIDYPPDVRALFLQHYAPEKTPDDYGGQYGWAFNYIRDQVVHFPHFLRDPEHRLMTRAMPDAAQLHAATLDVLKALTSYHKAYRAAFRHPVAERLSAVQAPTQVWRAEGELPDLRAAVDGLAARLPAGEIVEVGRAPTEKAAAIAAFLGRAPRS
ncbi:alpha/beta hydrolase [Sphingomonas sp. HITSZ_GF]|uniref:alpha/beta fold hydrolase n=1 Tax=Sphingomonas sp. HITSZ_GF TaxID=3037247 RepID=UPI00240E8EBB|nr:alpha/beta hydrolase [Sphingomonas sp. HITSZ_GF]MDG2532162.1 alpha/beta hydrolase [Sphingomonas sp. HITSZ_GF]